MDEEKKSFKDKVVGTLERLYGSAENALKAVTSKRAYVIGALVYLGISEMDWRKFLGLCALGCVFIWSETKRKPKE